MYVLQTVDGKPLPYVDPTSTERQGIRAQRITLYDDRSFTDVRETFSGPSGAERMFTDTIPGRYTKRGATLELAYPPTEWIVTTFEGTINGDELRLVIGWGPALLFRREP